MMMVFREGYKRDLEFSLPGTEIERFDGGRFDELFHVRDERGVLAFALLLFFFFFSSFFFFFFFFSKVLERR